MAYTAQQLIMAWTAVHDGIAPDTVTQADLQNRASQNAAGAITDAQALGYVINSADSTTALAVLSYQFFTGKSPSQAGLAYLVNSSTNAADLNDPYYSKFSLENRYINFAANLGVQGEGAAAFSTKYGAMTFAAYVASIYETIIGASYAKAAGIDPAAAIAYVVGRYDAILATAKSAGMITASMTQAQIDLAVKAATAGFLLGEAIKADVGLYAAAADNFMVALATGTATYNTDITTTYKPTGSQGTGQAVTATATPELPGAPAPPAPPTTTPVTPSPINLALTSNVETFVGGAVGDTFTATNATLQAGDSVDGQGGSDTLTITSTLGGVYTVPAATIRNIETVNISNNGGVVVDSTAWTGVTKLTANTSAGGQAVTASTSTDVAATASNVGSSNITVTGGHNVTVNATGTTSGALTVDGATGAVVVARTVGGAAGAAPASTVHGGTTVDFTLTATTPAPSDTQLTGTITIQGAAATTSVKVKAAQEIADENGHGAVTATDVTITDARYGTSTKGTITSVEVNGYGDLAINDSALATLKASHGGDITIDNDDPVAAPVTTLTATVDDVHGELKDQGVYTTLTLTNGSNASEIDLNMTGLTAITIAGAGSLSLYPRSTVLQTLTVTGSTNFSTDIDASVTTLTTGSGADWISVGNTISKAISLGAGDDTIFVTGATISATVNGGDGADTVSLDTVDVSTLIPYLSYLQNFERIELQHGNAFTVDVAALGFHYVIVDNGNGMTLNGFGSGDTLAVTNGTSYTLGSANFGHANDSLNLVLSGTGGSSVTAAGVETLNVNVTHSGGASINWQGNDLKTMVVTGTESFTLLASSTALTSVDASGMTSGDFTWTTANPNGTLTFTGSAHGTNTFTISGRPTSNVIYEGGTGDDIVTLDNDNTFNVVHLGAGDNYFVGDATSVTAGAGDDYVRTSMLGGAVNLGDGHNVLISNNSEIHYTGGSGYDEVFVAAGANEVDVGSGNDYVEIDAVDPDSATVFTAITGMGAGDKLAFASGAANNAAATSLGAQTTLSGTHTLAEYLDAAAHDVAGTTNTLHWFVLGSDLYIVSDVSDATTFVDGADAVVKLVGAAGLAATMGATVVSAGEITFH